MNVTILQPLSNWVDAEHEWLLTEAARHRIALDTSTQHGLTSSWQNKQTNKNRGKNSNLNLIQPLELITGAWKPRAQRSPEGHCRNASGDIQTVESCRINSNQLRKTAFKKGGGACRLKNLEGVSVDCTVRTCLALLFVAGTRYFVPTKCSS